MDGQFGGRSIRISDLSRLNAKYPFIAFMPQWDFLNFLREHGKRFASLKVMMNAEATELIWSGDTVVGVKADTPEGPVDIRADLTVACDGRHSVVREKAKLEVAEIGAPIDVLWFRVSRLESDGDEVFGHMEAGQMMVMLNRGDYWQCAYVIPKGGIEKVKQEGIATFRARVLSLSSFLRDRVVEIRSFDS